MDAMTTNGKTKVAVLLGLVVAAMLGVAIVAYTVPSARGDMLRSPQGTSGDAAWTVGE